MKLIGNENFNVDLSSVIFSNTVKSSYAPDRLEKWYGYGSNLQSIKDGRSEVKWIEDFPDWLEDMRVRFFPESNSALLCKGEMPESNTSIDWHRDHGNFENSVVMINFGESAFYVQTYDDGLISKDLKTGDIVEFNSKLLHKSIQTSTNRYIITFRKVKREYLKHKLF